jgi:hypothetical protein
MRDNGVITEIWPGLKSSAFLMVYSYTIKNRNQLQIGTNSQNNGHQSIQA